MPTFSDSPTSRQETIKLLSERSPRLRLAEYPTPLLPATHLAKALHTNEIWIKRDDLISFGLGGNKIRGLEVMLADAQSQHTDTLITGAGAQSNHVRATASVAAYAGLACTAVYWGHPPEKIDGNYRLTTMLNATICFTGDDDRNSVDTAIQQLAATQREQGFRPYAIPRGGACAMGALGHVLAVFELYQQCVERNLEPDACVFAVGSGGTYAGLLLGVRLLRLPWQLLGYTVSREPEQVSQQVAHLATEAAVLLRVDWQFDAEDAPVLGGFIGQGYGIPSPEAAEAIKLLAGTEGILLDPVYTGKAMAGLLQAQRNRQFVDLKKIVFIHTGGAPAFFAGDGEWLNTIPVSIDQSG